MTQPQATYQPRCTCVVTNHDHPVRCYRRASRVGGICDTCRYWHTFPEGRP